jgi:N-acetylglucosamine kinase-like BadF-type ATPase
MTAPVPRPPVLLLGVDGGGTTTEAWLAEPGGKLIGRGTAGPSNAKAVGLPSARQALHLAIQAAFQAGGLDPLPVDIACLGLAGFDRPDDRKLLTEWADEARWARRIVLANDGDLVVAAGTPEGFGIGVIAGTGSIAVGRSSQGCTARAGGWGHIIGDEGSAYRVVLDALRLVARRADGREPTSPRRDRLTERLCAALGVGEPAQIVTVIYASDFSRAQIASLAPSVLAAGDEDTEVISRLLVPAGAALAEMVVAVARSLDWQSGPLAVAAAGGFLLSANVVLEEMVSGILRHGYQVTLTRVTHPVRGAVVLAERAMSSSGQSS